MKTSKIHPKGGPNDWSIDDYNSWTALLAAALEIMTEQGMKASDSSDIAPQVAYQKAAKNIGLKGGSKHWLIDLCLANHHGLFSCEYGDQQNRWYMRADTWLKSAPFASTLNVDFEKEAERQAAEGLIPQYLSNRC